MLCDSQVHVGSETFEMSVTNTKIRWLSQIRLMGIAEPFKDLNENRLTKFEIALMLTKVRS